MKSQAKLLTAGTQATKKKANHVQRLMMQQTDDELMTQVYISGPKVYSIGEPLNYKIIGVSVNQVYNNTLLLSSAVWW
jgi:hypothetical protein